jgi:hypothetical protein
MRTTYLIHNFVEIFSVGVVLDRQELLEFGNKAEDRPVRGEEKFLPLLCPIE